MSDNVQVHRLDYMESSPAPPASGRPAVRETTLRAVGEKLRSTREVKIVDDPVERVELLAQRHALNDGERAGVLRNLIEGGHLTGYGLVNAATRFAQRVKDHDRATEWEVRGVRWVLPREQKRTLTASA